MSNTGHAVSDPWGMAYQANPAEERLLDTLRPRLKEANVDELLQQRSEVLSQAVGTSRERFQRREDIVLS